MELKDVRAAADIYSGKASDLSRQLAFAGIAVIWIFRVGEKTGGIAYSGALLVPLLLFVASLALDLIHYVYGSVAWLIFHRRKELALRNLPADSKFKAPRWINWPTNFFFYGKVILNIVGYLQLLSFIKSQL